MRRNSIKELKIISKKQPVLGGQLLNSANHALCTATASKDLEKGRHPETSMNKNREQICVAQFCAGTSEFVQVYVSWTTLRALGRVAAWNTKMDMARPEMGSQKSTWSFNFFDIR